VFLVNSRQALFAATSDRLGVAAYTVGGTPSPEVTGSICRVP